MLTPAEEMGLYGLSLAGRIRKAFYRMSEQAVLALIGRIYDESVRRHLVYLRDGQTETVRVLPCPFAVLPEQRSYIHSISLTIQNALKRLPELYFQDAAVRDVLHLLPQEEEWLRKCWDPNHGKNNPVFGRLDALIDFTSPMWKSSLRFLEPNLSGVGGLHLTPTCERIVAEVVLPVLHDLNSDLQLDLGHDVRELLIQELFDHATAIDRPLRTLCFIEPKYAGSGPDEQEELARYFHERYHLRVFHADPAELTCCGDEVYYQGEPIDLAYRDYSVYDLLDLKGTGVDIEPMFTLFRQNRIVSSIAAELDQKSCWEVFTDPQLMHKHFSFYEQLVFRRHILWTRVLSDRVTVLPDGTSGDLLEYVRREQEVLVLKPNRAYGGQGVMIGPSVERSEWLSAVQQGLSDSDRWVVQQLASIPVQEFPVVGPDGRVHLEPFYTVMGFAPTKHGLAILGRASQKQVINVAQRGGMCAVFLGRPNTQLVGPGPVAAETAAPS